MTFSPSSQTSPDVYRFVGRLDQLSALSEDLLPVPKKKFDSLVGSISGEGAGSASTMIGTDDEVSAEEKNKGPKMTPTRHEHKSHAQTRTRISLRPRSPAKVPNRPPPSHQNNQAQHTPPLLLPDLPPLLRPLPPLRLLDLCDNPSRLPSTVRFPLPISRPSLPHILIQPTLNSSPKNNRVLRHPNVARNLPLFVHCILAGRGVCKAGAEDS